MGSSGYEIGVAGEYEKVETDYNEHAKRLIQGFNEIKSEISRGYESGTRLRFVSDESSEDGFRQITQDEELKMLYDDFSTFVNNRYGEKRQKVVNIF